MKMTPAARLRLLAGTAIAATTTLAAPAFAQASEDDARGLQEIIVTAQKREQSLQDVPIAVTAVSGASLQANRITNVVDLSAIAPGVTVRPSLGSSSIPSFTIRGAVSYGVVPGSDKQVSMYIDGVYLSSPRGGIFDLPNVERIEILRGPQGTLFGRNATAGAVSIMTQDPMGEGHVKASVSVGNDDLRRYELTAHTPELGPLSGYFTYVKNEYRGAVRNGFAATFDRNVNALKYNRLIKSARWLGSKDSDSVFAAVKFESGDFKAVYKYDRNDSVETPGAVGLINYDFRRGVGALFGAYVNAIVDDARANGMTLAVNGKRPDEAWNSYNADTEQFNYGHNLRFEYQINDQLSIRNIAAYRSSFVRATASLIGVDALPIPQSATDEYIAWISSINPAFAALTPAQQQGSANAIVGQLYCVLCSGPVSSSKQWSNELQVNYDSDFLTLTVGAMYFKGEDWINEHGQQNTVSFTQLANGAIPYLPGIGYNEAKSLAAYAQGEIHVTPQLDIVLGGRFTQDKKLAELTSLTTATCPSTITQSAALKNCPLSTSRFNYKDDRFNYLVGVNFKPTEEMLLYAKWSTAYVSGGKVGPITFEPETAKSAEAGVKADLFNRRVRANLAVYWAEYKNYQTAQGGNTLGTLPEFIALVPDARVRNALGTFVYPQGDVTAKGFEFELTAAPIDGILLGGGLSYDKTTFKNVPGLLKAAQNLPATAPDSDYRPTLRPKWTASAYAQYTSQPIWGDATFTARVQGNYQSTMAAAANRDIKSIIPFYTAEIPGYWLINARAAIEKIPFGGLEGTIAVWGKNLTDNRSISFPFNQSGGAAATFIEPRRYGVDLTVEF
jgi:iron complex outermembrane receptor protein